MARSALDASIVSSTAKLMALLDLNEEPKENMDDVDIDLALDVPDTPDIFVRNDMVGDEKDFNSPVAGNSEYSELLYRGVSSRMKRHGMAIPEGSNNKTLHPQSRKDLSVHNIIELGSSPIVNSLGNTSASKNGHPEGSNNKALHPQSRKDLSVHNIIELASSPIVNSLGNTSASKNAHPFRTLEHHNPQWESEPFAQPKYAENVPSGSHSHGNDRANLSADFSGNAEESASDVRILDPSNNKVIDLMSPEIRPYSIRDRNAKRKMAIWNINLDKGKGLCAEVPSRNSACVNKNGVLNLMGRRQHTGKPEKACMAKEADIGWKAVNGCSSLYDIANSPRAPSNDYNDTSKIDMQIINCTHDSNPNTRDLPVLPVQPARAGKNLSSSNIARAKQASENHGNSLVNGEQADVGGVISNGETLSCRTSIVRSDSRGRLGNHKGKGVLKDVSMAEEQSVEGMQLHSRGPVNNMEEDSGFGNGCGNAFRYFDSIGGWRNFRNRSKMASLPPFDVVDYPSRSGCRCVSRIEGDHESVVDNGSSTDLVEVSDVSALQHNPTAIAQSSSSDLSELARENGLHGLHGANKLTKWQKKEGSTSSNIGACSTSSATDSDISCLPSAVDPLTSRSIRRKNRHHRGNPGPLIVIDDFSPETRGGNSLDISRLVDNDSVARARQVEADEILAQQLQEQLYSESPGALGELDANIAWALQQEEEARPASYRGNPRSSHPRDSSMSHLYRQYPSQSFQDLPVGSANRARHPSSARTGWLRNRIRNQSPTVSSWERNFQFPPNMDFEMRIHLLEQLEATVGNSHGMRLDGHLFQRDFNENDYEMLLALDENNHQHVGASAIQINSLPQSTIQTESFEEACAICLDTPKTGEIIRHLPCLHKFHRDCIDPWLRRKRSCPICKSSVT